VTTVYTLYTSYNVTLYKTMAKGNVKCISLYTMIRYNDIDARQYITI